MGDYKAGDLNLSVQTISNDTIKSLDAVIERLSLIEKGLGTMSGFARGRSPYIRKSTSASRTEKTYSVGRHGKEYLTLSKDIQRAEKSLKTITTQFDRQGKVLKKTTVDVDEYGNKITKIFGGYSKGTSKGGIFGVAKLGVYLHLMRRLGRFMGNLVQAGSDYNETLNLWQVAMRNNLDVADQFINKMQKAYGISTKTLMNAQAIFKNMIGSLGQISDQTAYALSEALVQMSADFSSLYNVKLTEAFNKMQAMLARQVRPIRSVSGYDITENTLYELYQTLGGTKTMRQLNNTEKQLLSIYAVFKQMGASGALGDMSKTLNQFANQSRMMTEYWAELKTWSGLLLKDLIDQSGMLININALLITATEIVKAIARSRGLGEENFLTGMFETTSATNDEVDELQGKLLDFDKFRSLEGATASPLAIDEKLLQAISGYSSKIDQAQNAAQQLANEWGEILGFTIGANGEWQISEENLSSIENTLTAIGIALGVVIGLGIFSWLVKLGTNIYTYGIKPLITFGKFIYTHAITPLINWTKQILLTTPKMKLLELGFLAIGVAVLGMGLNEFISNFDKLSSSAKVWIPIIAALTGVVTAVAAGLTFLKGNWIGAIGLGATVAGIGLMVGTQLAIPNYEMGASDIDSGTVFRAGEFGKTEAVYTGSNGKTNVANVRQMEQAFFNALSRHSREGNGTIVVQAYLDGEKVYENTTEKAKARGKVWANA